MTDDDALRETLRRIELLVNTLSNAVATLDKTVTALQGNVVTKEGLANVTARVTSTEEGVKRNDERWAKVAWFVGLAILAALLGLVLAGGPGIKP